MIAIVETNKLHIDNIFDLYNIYAYSVDSTLCAIMFELESPPYTTHTLTEEEFSVLQKTPDWNFELIQDTE